MTIRPGDEWGTPTDDAADVVVTGDDRALAAALTDLDASTLVDFLPDAASDFARAIGLDPKNGAYQMNKASILFMKKSWPEMYAAIDKAGLARQQFQVTAADLHRHVARGAARPDEDRRRGRALRPAAGPQLRLPRV